MLIETIAIILLLRFKLDFMPLEIENLPKIKINATSIDKIKFELDYSSIMRIDISCDPYLDAYKLMLYTSAKLCARSSVNSQQHIHNYVITSTYKFKGEYIQNLEETDFNPFDDKVL